MRKRAGDNHLYHLYHLKEKKEHAEGMVGKEGRRGGCTYRKVLGARVGKVVEVVVRQ
jgi:hypothetical protein